LEVVGFLKKMTEILRRLPSTYGIKPNPLEEELLANNNRLSVKSGLVMLLE
jgi:hypothetical protein